MISNPEEKIQKMIEHAEERVKIHSDEADDLLDAVGHPDDMSRRIRKKYQTHRKACNSALQELTILRHVARVLEIEV